MFEKEAKEYMHKDGTESEKLLNTIDLSLTKRQAFVLINICKQCFKDGAFFGYNKAKEWHYVKDKLPPIGETVLLYFGTNFMGKVIMCTGCVDCKGNWYKNVDGEPIKWQKIVLPKEINEND